MGRKRIRKSIADNPLSRNLAWLFRHPDSGHPDRHSLKGFKMELLNVHRWVARKYPNERNFKISPNTIENWICEYRFPLFDSIIKLCEAYNALYGDNISPYDLYVDRTRWVERHTIREAIESVAYSEKAKASR